MNKIISEEEKNFLLSWIKNNRKYFKKNYNGPHRFYFIIQESHLEIPELFFNIKERILKNENINSYELEPVYKDMITFITNGGFIHKHTDPTPNGYDQIRFNLLLSKPTKGGEPIYDGNVLSVEERDYFKYYVNIKEHSTNVVIGCKPRITISYGILVKHESTKNN